MALSPAEVAAWLALLTRVAAGAQKAYEFSQREPTQEEIDALRAEADAADAEWQTELAKLRNLGTD